MKKIILFSFLILFSFPLLAVNTVILKNGKTIKGKVTDQNEKGLTVQTSEGTQTFPKSQILKVVYKDVSAEEADKIRLAEEKKLREKEEKEKDQTRKRKINRRGQRTKTIRRRSETCRKTKVRG